MTGREWLVLNVVDAPPSLLDAMIEALPADSTSVPDDLVAGARNLYRVALDGNGGREDAYPLLAADALLTHAFEAQAALDPYSIPAFVERVDTMLAEGS